MMIMERRGLKLEDIFRAKYRLSQETNLFVMIQEAISAVSFGNPKEFMKKRSSLAETLFSRPRDSSFDDQFADEDSRKGNKTITSPDALSTSKDPSCIIKKRCDSLGTEDSKKKMRIIIKVPKMAKEVTAEVNKKGLDQEVSGKHCARSDGNDMEKKGRQWLIKVPGKLEENTSNVDKKFNQENMGFDGLGSGVGSGTHALATKETKKHCDRLINSPKGHKKVNEKLGPGRGSEHNGNLRREPLMKPSNRCKEVSTEGKKKPDRDSMHTKFEGSVKKMESIYQQIRENKRKIQVLDMKDLPPSKSRCMDIRDRRPCSNFKKQLRFRRPVYP